MFEDQANNGNVPPPNLPFQPDDMLAEVEKNEESTTVNSAPNALSAGVLKKKEPLDGEQMIPREKVEMPQSNTYVMKAPILGKVITFVLVVVLLVAIGFGGWWIYSKIKSQGSLSKGNQNNTNNSIVVDPNKNISPVSTSTATSDINSPVLVGEQTDTDKDNLDDAREAELKTNPQNSDTDGDGLKDGDEVLIWHTDPLNPDTDSDGYKDGEEVKNGYNPLGAGKLFNVPSSTTPTPSI
jgi:hypothetical protein